MMWRFAGCCSGVWPHLRDVLFKPVLMF
ncbi:hypothetical protein RHRU231_450086 [Rhodococcus ruber]|uniref:Uncharacterized protein n=1 Tax=Rhodococcus ruber TaxID=1830 RepID=A0A098BJJ6_9NOCA|nr:hypothetical protein RHRU231_450086 [Rhodococcus ruber]